MQYSDYPFGLNTYTLSLVEQKYWDIKTTANNAPHFKWLAADSLFDTSEFYGKKLQWALDTVKLGKIKDMVYTMYPDKANQDLWKKCKENIDTNIRNVLRNEKRKCLLVPHSQDAIEHLCREYI